MITTGSKLFVGAGVLATIGAVLYGVIEGGATGTVGLTFAAVVLFFLGGLTLYIRDANVSSMDVAAVQRAPAGAMAPSNSMWPAVAAMGGALIVIGLVTYQVVFVFGVIAIVAAAAEWMVGAWSERASSDAAHNAAVRERIAHPLEFPVLALVGAAVLIYSFSRIMLALTRAGGPVAFAVIAVLLLAVGFIVAFKPSLRIGAVAALAVIAGLGLVSGGIVAAVQGEREVEAHETTDDLAALGHCDDPDETHADDDASQTVAAKANITAEITLHGDGTMTARNLGITGDQDYVEVIKANPTNVRFINESDAERRLVLNGGTRPEDPTDPDSEMVPFQQCTALTEEGGSQFMTFSIFQSSAVAAEPMSFVVPGVDGAMIEVRVS
jgi:hypothetical protein